MSNARQTRAKVDSPVTISNVKSKGGIWLMGEVVSWINELFPSSRSLARLISLPQQASLIDGEIFNHIAILSAVELENNRLVRGMTISFAAGLAADELCPTQFIAYVDVGGQIFHICKATFVDKGDDWEELFDHVYADTRRTPASVFQSRLAELEYALLQAIATGEKGRVIPEDHPLLNRKPFTKASFHDNSDGKCR